MITLAPLPKNHDYMPQWEPHRECRNKCQQCKRQRGEITTHSASGYDDDSIYGIPLIRSAAVNMHHTQAASHTNPNAFC